VFLPRVATWPCDGNVLFWRGKCLVLGKRTVSGTGESAEEHVIQGGSELGHGEEKSLIEFPVRGQNVPVPGREIPCSRIRELSR
jgi:hypothetical protein